MSLLDFLALTSCLVVTYLFGYLNGKGDFK